MGWFGSIDGAAKYTIILFSVVGAGMLFTITKLYINKKKHREREERTAREKITDTRSARDVEKGQDEELEEDCESFEPRSLEYSFYNLPPSLPSSLTTSRPSTPMTSRSMTGSPTFVSGAGSSRSSPVAGSYTQPTSLSPRSAHLSPHSAHYHPAAPSPRSFRSRSPLGHEPFTPEHHQSAIPQAPTYPRFRAYSAPREPSFPPHMAGHSLAFERGGARSTETLNHHQPDGVYGFPSVGAGASNNILQKPAASYAKRISIRAYRSFDALPRSYTPYRKPSAPAPSLRYDAYGAQGPFAPPASRYDTAPPPALPQSTYHAPSPGPAPPDVPPLQVTNPDPDTETPLTSARILSVDGGDAVFPLTPDGSADGFVFPPEGSTGGEEPGGERGALHDPFVSSAEYLLPQPDLGRARFSFEPISPSHRPVLWDELGQRRALDASGNGGDGGGVSNGINAADFATHISDGSDDLSNGFDRHDVELTWSRATTPTPVTVSATVQPPAGMPTAVPPSRVRVPSQLYSSPPSVESAVPGPLRFAGFTGNDWGKEHNREEMAEEVGPPFVQPQDTMIELAATEADRSPGFGKGMRVLEGC